VGCPDRRIDRLCITCCSSSQPSHHAGGFKHKVKAKAYQVIERAGMVWVYMGSRAKAPPLPALEILDVPNDEVGVSGH